MKPRNIMISLGVAAALAAGVGAYSHTASAQGGGYGPGMMGGYGPGMMGGNGPGYGPNGGYGYDPGYGYMRSYGPGWMGPGMMSGYGPGGGYGPYGMMASLGPNGPCAGGWGASQQQANLNLTVDQVKNNIEQWLKANGNSHIKLGNVAVKDADTIIADIVTTDKDALVQRYAINRHTGFRQPTE